MPWSIYDKPEFKRHETQTDQQVLWHQSRCVVSRNHCQLATLIGCVLTTVQLPASVWRSHDLDETACAEYRTRPACTVPETRQQTNIIINQKHWDSAYLCQGTSYQCHDTDLDLYPDPYPDLWSESPPKFNHLFTGHFQPSLKISCKSVPKFLRKNLPTDRQTDRQWRKHNFLGGGKRMLLSCTQCLSCQKCTRIDTSTTGHQISMLHSLSWIICIMLKLTDTLYIWYRLPSVLWCCWLGGRKGIRPVKN